MWNEYLATCLVIYDGVILVSGSRSIGNCKPFADLVINAAKKRNWCIVTGDARGVDTTVSFWALRAGVAVTNVYVTQLGLRTPKLFTRYHHHFTVGVGVGNIPAKQAFAVRDKEMVWIVRQSKNCGFMALWDGQSRGTRLTADYARAKGIPGIIYGLTSNGYPTKIEVWD